MGNICSNCLESKDQTPKRGAIDTDDSNTNLQVDSSVDGAAPPSTVHVPNMINQHPDHPSSDTALLQKEQARLELIVSKSGQKMVPVRSMRSNQPTYYDQGFAAAFKKHLAEQMSDKSGKNDSLLTTLPQSNPDQSTNLHTQLSRSPYATIQLGTSSSGLAGCDSEHPSKYVDRIAEQLLAEMLPTKEHLFLNGNGETRSEGPLVENLL